MEDASTIYEQHNDTSIAAEYAAVKKVVQDRFPELWGAVEVGLAASATLLLNDIANCTALIYVGSASAGKTTVVSMFADAVKPNGDTLVHRSDKFTPAAFLTHAAQRTEEDLKKIDLLPKIQNKILLTPEMAPVFSGDKRELIPVFQVITRVLDGEGLSTDSGVHGSRSCTGDYVFTWLGCTTPFGSNVWETMSQLGSRLFFLMLETDGGMDEEALVASMSGESASYLLKRNECKEAVSGFVSKLFRHYTGYRGVVWDASADDEKAIRWIARLALLLSRTRGVTGEAGIEVESAGRAKSVLHNLARARALVQGRRSITIEDVRPIARVTLSSMPTGRSKVLTALVRKADGKLTTGDVKSLLRVGSEEKARKVMNELDQLGIVVFRPGSPGKSGVMGFSQPRWGWCAEKEFRDLLS